MIVMIATTGRPATTFETGPGHTLRYISTRGGSDPLSFKEVTLAGLAPDGGLFVPDAWPTLTPDEIASLNGLPYAQAAARVMTPFVADALDPDAFGAMIADAYAGFRHPDVAPLVEIGPDRWVLELFHGPTLAFKDIALQLLGRLFDAFIADSTGRLTVLGATSGDTGSAAIEACRGRERVDIFMLHPKGRVSDIQRRQMTTVVEPNVVNIAVDGTFDDCQAIVKALFADQPFRARVGLTAVNSINWARVMAQTVYYFTAATALGAPARPVSFSVPTGNFGDVYAGYVAAAMGLPIARLGVATNVNDILVRTLASGDHRLDGVQATLSPSMDIQISSNFERLLFDLYDRDGAEIARRMAALKAERAFRLDAPQLERARSLFRAARVDDAATLDTIARVHADTGYLLDPHTAVGVAAAADCLADQDGTVVTLATAHPAKFPDAVERATGVRPALPEHLADLMDRPERAVTLPADAGAVRGLIDERVAA